MIHLSTVNIYIALLKSSSLIMRISNLARTMQPHQSFISGNIVPVSSCFFLNTVCSFLFTCSCTSERHLVTKLLLEYAIQICSACQKMLSVFHGKALWSWIALRIKHLTSLHFSGGGGASLTVVPFEIS